MFWSERLGHLVVTRMEDIEHVFTDPDVFASTNVQDPIYPLCPAATDILSDPDFNPVAVMSNPARARSQPNPDLPPARVSGSAG